jgi:type I restriction enzyme S subunit
VAKVDELMALCDELEEKQQRKATVTTKLRGSAFNALRQAETSDDLAAEWERISTNWSHLTNHPESIPELRKTILKLAMGGCLLPQDPSDEPANPLVGMKSMDHSELPPGWISMMFSEHFDIRGGGQPPKSLFQDKPGAGLIRLWQIRDFGPNPVPTYIPEETATRTCEKGDILIARYGASGKVFWAEGGAYNVAIAKFVYPESVIFRGYAFLMLQVGEFQDVAATTTRMAQAGFNKKDLANVVFKIPPMAEQKRIVSKVDELMAVCDDLERQLHHQQDLSSRLAIASTRLAG